MIPSHNSANHALQRTRLPFVVGDSDAPGVAGSLSLGRWPIYNMHTYTKSIAALLTANLLFFGCSDSELPVSQASLQIQESVKWQMKVDAQNRLLVDIEIEGQQCVLQIDTGASGLSLPQTVIGFLKSAEVIANQGMKIPQIGIDPNTNKDVVTYSVLRSFRVGGLSVNKGSAITETGQNFGLAGNMLFGRKCVTINWAQGVVIIEEQVVMQHGWLKIPLIYRWGNVPVVSARIGTERGLLIVDTGANATVLDDHALQNAGAQLMSDNNGVDSRDARRWAVKELVLEGHERSSDVVLSETSIFGLQGITNRIGVTGSLGVDFMRRFPSIIMDYRNNLIALSPPEPAGQQSGQLDATSRRQLP